MFNKSVWRHTNASLSGDGRLSRAPDRLSAPPEQVVRCLHVDRATFLLFASRIDTAERTPTESGRCIERDGDETRTHAGASSEYCCRRCAEALSNCLFTAARRAPPSRPHGLCVQRIFPSPSSIAAHSTTRLASPLILEDSYVTRSERGQHERAERTQREPKSPFDARS